jgi:hypothetical protein
MLRELVEKQKTTCMRYLALLERTACALEQNDLDNFGELEEAHRGLAERMGCYDKAIKGWAGSAKPDRREERALDELRRMGRCCIVASAALQKQLRGSMVGVRRQLEAARRHLAGRRAGHVEPTMVDISR